MNEATDRRILEKLSFVEGGLTIAHTPSVSWLPVELRNQAGTNIWLLNEGNGPAQLGGESDSMS